MLTSNFLALEDDRHDPVPPADFLLTYDARTKHSSWWEQLSARTPLLRLRLAQASSTPSSARHVIVPGTPIWIDTRPIWDSDEDWFRLLAKNAVVVPGPATERLGDTPATTGSGWSSG